MKRLAFLTLLVLSLPARADDAQTQAPKSITVTLDVHDQMILRDLIMTAGVGCAPTAEGQIRCRLGIEAKDLSDNIDAQADAQHKK